VVSKVWVEYMLGPISLLLITLFGWWFNSWKQRENDGIQE